GGVGRVGAIAPSDRLNRDEVLCPAGEALADVPDLETAELGVVSKAGRWVVRIGGVLQHLLGSADSSAGLRGNTTPKLSRHVGQRGHRQQDQTNTRQDRQQDQQGNQLTGGRWERATSFGHVGDQFAATAAGGVRLGGL